MMETSEVAAIASLLKRPDKVLLLRLPGPGSYEVGVLRGVPFTTVRRLRASKLIEEQWTWASGATPDTGLTQLGAFVRDFLLAERKIAPAKARGETA